MILASIISIKKNTYNSFKFNKFSIEEGIDPEIKLFDKSLF